MGGGGRGWFGSKMGDLIITTRRGNRWRALSPQGKYIHQLLEARARGHKFHVLWSTPTTLWLINKAQRQDGREPQLSLGNWVANSLPRFSLHDRPPPNWDPPGPSHFPILRPCNAWNQWSLKSHSTNETKCVKLWLTGGGCRGRRYHAHRVVTNNKLLLGARLEPHSCVCR